MGKKLVTSSTIVLLALVLRLVLINQSFWLDEASQAIMSSQKTSEIWLARTGDFHPPLFYVLAHFWLQFGKSEMWLRLLPVFFGVTTVRLLYKTYGKWPAFFLAINQFHIYYSQEFRTYSLLGLLGLWSIHNFSKRSKWWFIPTALLLYTHYSSALLIAAQLLYVIVFDRKQWKFWLAQIIWSVILYLPWVPQLWQQLQNGFAIDSYLPGWRNLLSLSPLKSIPLILFKLTAGRIDLLPRSIYAVYLSFVLVSLLMAILVGLRDKLLAFLLVVPLILGWGISFWLPQMQPFRLIFLLPTLMVIISNACRKFPKLFFTIFIYISVVGVGTYWTRPRLQREQWRQAIEFLNSQPHPVVVKFFGPFDPMRWYSTKFPIIAVMPPAVVQIDSKTLWLMDYLTGLTDPTRLVDAQLEQVGYAQQQIINFEGVGFIRKYERKN